MKRSLDMMATQEQRITHLLWSSTDIRVQICAKKIDLHLLRIQEMFYAQCALLAMRHGDCQSLSFTKAKPD